MDKDQELLKVLRGGGVAVIPTDTIYGIVGKALNEEAVLRIYAIKKRAPKKPFIILISNISQLDDFGIALSDFEKDYLKKNWPGPTSIILPCKKEKLSYLHRGTNSLAFRLPDKKELLNILNITGPLVAPSANPEGEAPATNIEEAGEYFKDKIDYYYDAGIAISKPSRLVLLEKDSIKVLRK
jgi:L-threonylcarbamoyladenylate synthase